MEKITDKQIDHLAELSSLALSDKEKAKMKTDLEQILTFVDKIEKCDQTSDLSFDNAVSLNSLREDIPSQSLSQEEALQNAPKAENGAYVVSKVVD